MQVPPQPPAQQTPQPVPVQVPPKIVQKVPQPMQVPPQPPAQQTPQPVPVQVPPKIVQKVPQPMQVPPQPPAQQAPQPVPVQVPPKIVQKVPQPMQVPPQPPAQQTPRPVPVQVPPKIVQKVPQPMQVPPQPPAQQTPQPVPVQVPPKIVQKVPQPQTAAPSNLVSLLVAPHPSLVHKPAISSTRPTTQVTGPGQAGKRPPVTDRPVTQVGTGSRPRPVLTAHKPASVTSTSPHVVSVPGRVPPQITGPKQPVQPSHVVQPQSHSAALPSGLSGELWSQEVIEPGIQNQRVELYRSNDAEEVLYKDVIPMDKTGFHLTVFGTRPPAYQ
ncbi:hypothetical protein DWB85_15470 [Seongchinamella sediminis]|uniref:Uncharacterized protein n=2 Tax=Seongchinamella sediminis TaxID=2283635 RepID=A0A3L7DT62_9GAMM|nr:hypothetical protein DWB85_15470 [Seongchinamella sediminis]